ncbi:shwachman-Bodian-Diamond syndrome protein [Thecamonas trahens ATCC 50062]|uniref:Shwachman-Bodian-Diamond syndrome protein n=1 Tax=Thecamonas trahens ATCC 50062 TaxID=461836 RepID=A0A0L0DG37_THETB|nr:shwachman-Bodian-Diamond syndrome protein [Thecamonas trahens ATCC 50062]KNC51284.1 shwachman-Bodian-Diamond syndrome protein [Thecamonas trahens ATCC 50062]|eukprot:XP_013756210.1 shwachman-Bodian-Diamond syndrome protein [Thecamonas trahens ATCC 50062]
MAANFQAVRIKKGKATYEVLTHPNTINGYRDGAVALDSCLAVEQVFRNSSKGETVALSELQDAFGLETEMDVARLILDEGEVMLNAADRKAKMDEVHRAVVAFIHKHFVDPKSMSPHPLVRIENALVEAKVRLDMDTSAEDQVNGVIKKLRPIIPLKKAELEATVTLSHAKMGAALGVLHGHAQVGHTDYTADGCVVSIGLLPGDLDGLVAALDKCTSGEYSLTIAGTEDLAVAESEAAASGKGKKKGKGGKRGKKGRK